VLLIADEVICGFGRTGSWFGCDTFDIKPDLMPMAKGVTSGYLPLSAVMVGKKVGETMFHGGGEFAHGYTYSGHPACCAVAIENIKIMEEEGLVEKVGQETGPYLQEKLQDFLDHPLVGEVRGVGLLGAFELVKDKASRTHFDDLGKVGGICRDHCMDNAVVLRAVRDCMVMSPPLIMEKKDIDEMLSRARKALDATARDLGVM
jgi:putrescine aminotransferase